MKKILTMIIAASLLASCGSSMQTSENETKDTMESSENQIITFEIANLRLTSLNENGSIETTDEVAISLNLDLTEGRYHGKSGCNNYFGKVEKINQDQIIFRPGGITEMMCQQDIMVWEAKYMNALVDKPFFVNVKDNVVMLSSASGDIQMQFLMHTP